MLELPVDLLALGFYYIQNFENYEIRRGRSGMGNYHLKAELKDAISVLTCVFSTISCLLSEGVSGINFST
jgi:hypothetical protein